MSSYIHFTEEQKQRAAAVDLEEFLRCRGEKLLSSGREKRLASDHSVTVRGNEWYDHAEERGGHAVSFVPVSYTHLDVYKRQVSACTSAEMSATCWRYMLRHIRKSCLERRVVADGSICRHDRKSRGDGAL